MIATVAKPLLALCVFFLANTSAFAEGPVLIFEPGTYYGTVTSVLEKNGHTTNHVGLIEIRVPEWRVGFIRQPYSKIKIVESYGPYVTPDGEVKNSFNVDDGIFISEVSPGEFSIEEVGTGDYYPRSLNFVDGGFNTKVAYFARHEDFTFVSTADGGIQFDGQRSNGENWAISSTATLEWFPTPEEE